MQKFKIMIKEYPFITCFLISLLELAVTITASILKENIRREANANVSSSNSTC